MFYTYIIYSKNIDKFYIGSSNDVYKRLKRHNIGHSKYTRKGVPGTLS
ncbi:MAG: GIY-YIG nuclease family protein [Bacteroidales bacterium]